VQSGRVTDPDRTLPRGAKGLAADGGVGGGSESDTAGGGRREGSAPLPVQPNQLPTGLDRNTHTDGEVDTVKRWLHTVKRWQVFLIVGALLGYLVVGALVIFDPHGVVSIKTATGKIVQVPTAEANGSTRAAFVLALPVLYLGLLQVLRVKLPERFAEEAWVFTAGLAIGAVSEPVGNGLLTGAIVGIAMGAAVITLIHFGRRSGRA
jgi:hypothetical protein